MKGDELHIAVQGGEIHLDVVSMLKALEWEDTPANRNTLCRHFVTELRRRSPTIRIVAVQGGGRQN
jgi:hypothetical protein